MPLSPVPNDKSTIWQVVWMTTKNLYGELELGSIQLAKLLTYRLDEKKMHPKTHPIFSIQNDKLAIWQVVWETTKILYGELQLRSIQLAKLLTYRFGWKNGVDFGMHLFFIQNDKSAIWQVVWSPIRVPHTIFLSSSIQLAKLLTYRFVWGTHDG